MVNVVASLDHSVIDIIGHEYNGKGFLFGFWGVVRMKQQTFAIIFFIKINYSKVLITNV